jgi:hypothetical protein
MWLVDPRVKTGPFGAFMRQTGVTLVSLERNLVEDPAYRDAPEFKAFAYVPAAGTSDRLAVRKDVLP